MRSAIVGAPVTISDEPGSPFSAFGDQLTGTTLSVVPARLIVQSWRSSNFHDRDPDSTLILSFVPHEDGAERIDPIRLDVPEQDYQGVVGGWDIYYWAPWKEYLQRLSQRAVVRTVSRFETLILHETG